MRTFLSAAILIAVTVDGQYFYHDRSSGNSPSSNFYPPWLLPPQRVSRGYPRYYQERFPLRYEEEPGFHSEEEAPTYFDDLSSVEPGSSEEQLDQRYASSYDDLPGDGYYIEEVREGREGKKKYKSKSKKKGGGWGWPEPEFKTVGWGWHKQQHVLLPGPVFESEKGPTIHIHPKAVHHQSKGWGWGSGGGGGGGGHGGGGGGHGGGHGGGGGGFGGGGGGYGGGGGGGGGWGWGKPGKIIHAYEGWGWGHK